MFSQRGIVSAANIDLTQRSGHCIETGSINQYIKCKIALTCFNTVGLNVFNATFAQVNQRHIVAIKSSVIIGINDWSFTAHRVVSWHQRLGRGIVIDYAFNLLAIHIAGQLVGLWINGYIGEPANSNETFFFHQRRTLGLCSGQNLVRWLNIFSATKAKTVTNNAYLRGPLFITDLSIIFLCLHLKIFTQRSIVGGHRIVRCALKHG